MKRNWEMTELIEQWTLLPRELSLLQTKTGSSKLVFAVWLKFFQLEGRFPRSLPEVPQAVIQYLSQQLALDPQEYNNSQPKERQARYYRAEILQFCGVRRYQASDLKELKEWLRQNVLSQSLDIKRAESAAREYLQKLGIVLMSPKPFERLIRSVVRTYETQLYERIYQQLTPDSCVALDQLLDKCEETSTDPQRNRSYSEPMSLFSWLNFNSGNANLNNLLEELKKLEQLRKIGLSEGLFSKVSPKIVSVYRHRAATESSQELRRHPKAIRYTLMAALVRQRSQEVTDNLVEMLIQIIHKLSSKAERRVTEELTQDFKKVSGKTQLLYRIAVAALANPEEKVKEVIYPIASPSTLKNLVQEFQKTGTTYRQKVHILIRRSYQYHYRRMVPFILEMLEFRSNNDVHQPVIEGLELLKKYANSRQPYYEPEEIVPLDGVLRSGWRDILTTVDGQGKEQIERVNYEIALLQALRERLRCKEIWVKGANRYQNPEQDLPTDFEVKRQDYYQALQMPRDVQQFISSLKQEMEQSLSRLNENLPNNPKVQLLPKKNGWIKLSPLSAQAEPLNLAHLKTELIRRWPMTSLLDILKEADLRIGLTDCFQTAAQRESLERSTLQKRLLFCLYALGTNTGLKRISNGTVEVSRDELRYIKRRYLHKDQLRQAIVEVVNATLKTRAVPIWGEGTVACASDSKKFGAWEQNLTTEWHFRYGGRGVMVYWVRFVG